MKIAFEGAAKLVQLVVRQQPSPMDSNFERSKGHVVRWDGVDHDS